MTSFDIVNQSTEVQEALTKVTRFYKEQLQKYRGALWYCQSRFSDKSLQDFEIGYDPGGDEIFKFLESEKINLSVLQGINFFALNEDGSLYNQFSNRVMFPIYGLNHLPIGFSGRVWQEGDVRAKYKNSSLSFLYQKALTLYGLSHAAYSIGMENLALVVEGNPDVITCHAHEIKTAVATCGSAFMREHLQLLSLFTDRIIFCFDNDESGRKTEAKIRETFKDEKRIKIGYLNLAGPKDLDEYLKLYGGDGIKVEIEKLSRELSCL